MARGRRLLEQEVDLNGKRVFNPPVPADPLDITALRDLSPQYANVAAVEADTQVRGDVVYVATFDDFFGYSATDTTARDGEMILNGPGGSGVPGRWHRMLVPSMKWRALLLSYSATAYPVTGGMFVSDSGSAQGAATLADPIPWREAQRRARGLQFNGLANDGAGNGAPLFQLVGNVTQDVHVSGFTYEYCIISARPTVVAASLTVASVADSDASGNPGSVTITGFNWTSPVRTSTATDCFFLRRTNTSLTGGAGTTTWAQIFDGNNAGVALTGKQVTLLAGANFGALQEAAGVRLFQAGDTVDLVTFPQILGHISATDQEVALILMQVTINEFVAELTGNIDAMVVGSTNIALQLTAGRIRGGMLVGGFSIGANAVAGACVAGIAAAGAGVGAVQGSTLHRVISGGFGPVGGIVQADLCHARNCSLGVQCTLGAEFRANAAISGFNVATGVSVLSGGKVSGNGNNALSALYAASTVKATIDGITCDPSDGHSIANEATGSRIDG